MSPQALKNLTSLPRHTKSPDNSNMCTCVNNNTYTDSRTANKQSLVPCYVIRVIKGLLLLAKVTIANPERVLAQD